MSNRWYKQGYSSPLTAELCQIYLTSPHDHKREQEIIAEMRRGVEMANYRFRQTGENKFEISKIVDGEVVKWYKIEPLFSGALSCSCPSHKQPCKHLKAVKSAKRLGLQLDGSYLWNEFTGQFTKQETVE